MMKTVFWWFIFMIFLMVAVVFFWLLGWNVGLGLFFFVMATSIMSQWTDETFDNPIRKVRKKITM